MKLSSGEKTSIFLALYVAGIIAANMIGGKLTSIFGVAVSVAVLSLPITYVVLNAINEVRGPIVPKGFVLAAVTALVALFGLLAVSLWLPEGPRQIMNLTSYNEVFGLSLRMIVASIVAFVISQKVVIWMFNKIKIQMREKHAWLRYNAASIGGALLDTFIFFFLAFYRGDVVFTVTLAGTYFLFKALFLVLSTPFFYGAVWWLRGSKNSPEEPVKVPVQVPEAKKN